MKADLADKVIAQAEIEGKDTSDPNVLKEMGEKVNAAGRPVHKSETVGGAIGVSLQLMAWYAIAIGIWSQVFKASILIFGFCGAVAGLIIGLIFVSPVIAGQRTKERAGDMAFGVGTIWGGIAVIIGVVGIAAWILKSLFV